MLAAGAVLAALAAPAHADPCTVDIVRAPDAVRPVIEEWVAAEPACATRLSVRVIETEAGLYVIATDPVGRIRERTVPDDVTAAVLIASWVADAGVAPAIAEPAPTSTPAQSPGLIDPFGAPARTPTSRDNLRTALLRMRRIAAVPERELALGMIASKQYGDVVRGMGVHVDMDVRSLRGWGARTRTWEGGLRLGVAASAMWLEGTSDLDRVEGTEARLMARLSASINWAVAELRAAVAAGASLTRVRVSSMGGIVSEPIGALAPAADATASYTVWLKGWGLRVGVVLAMQPELEGEMLAWQRGLEARAYVGIVHGW